MRVRRAPMDRFARMTRRDRSGCLLWTGSVSRAGQPRFNSGGHEGPVVLASRWAWEQANGPIPEGATVRRVCGSPMCVDVAHMVLRPHSGKTRTECRTLRPGEPIPAHAPKRYMDAHGYVILRWLVAPRSYVEVKEHRVVDGRVTTSPEVHHKNRDRADNRAENLEHLDAPEHGVEHRSVDWARVVDLYEQGYTQVEVGELLGCSAPQVSRILAASGVSIRPPAKTTVDETALRRLIGRGDLRVPAIAAELGVSPAVVRRAMSDFGIAAFPAGRPRRIQ